MAVPATRVTSRFDAGSAVAETLRLTPVSRAVVEDRLGQYAGTNVERQATLKRMFTEAGCGKHLSEQPVRRSKTPNLICVHPGTSGRVIIVGAHFDRVSAGDGIVDNWSGASLLPSLFQAIAIEPRQHTYVAMINMDTLGLASTNVWLNRSDKRLVLALGSVAKLLDLPLRAATSKGSAPDSESFAARRPSVSNA